MITIVLPTYNEVENINIIILKIAALFEREGLKGEIIVVDDNSPDGTAAAVRKSPVKMPIRVHVRKGDRGLSKSVLKGIELAENDICVLMDADLSHPVARIPDMVRPIITGECDMTVGSRYMPGGGWTNGNPLRGAISRFAGFLAKGVTTLSDPTSGFMAVRKNIFDNISIDPMGWKIVLEIAVKARPKVKEIPIMFLNRNSGKSKLDIHAQFDYLHHLMKLYLHIYLRQLYPINKK